MTIEPRPGILDIAPYVGGESKAAGANRVIRLASNENPLGPSPRAVQAAVDALAGAHRYPRPLADELRAALAARHRLRPEQVLVTNGSDELLRLLAETYLRPGDRVVVPHPSFSVYGRVAQLMGARIEAVPLARDGGMDLPAMAAACQGAGGRDPARIVFLCRPNNPTGGVFGAEAFAAFLAAVPGSCLIVLDEAYQEFDDTDFNGLDWLDRSPSLIVARTFSKVYGLSGLRLGWGAAAEAVWQPVLKVRDPFSVNVVAQAAGLAALGDPEHVARSVELAREGRDFLRRAASELGLRVWPSQGNFVLIDVARDADEVQSALLAHGVIVRSASGFGVPTAIRVSCGLPEENRRFAEALRAVLVESG